MTNYFYTFENTSTDPGLKDAIVELITKGFISGKIIVDTKKGSYIDGSWELSDGIVRVNLIN
jgi:hypothetical protein